MSIEFYNRLPTAQKIKEVYEQRGLSQEDIAKHLKCDIETIKLIENKDGVYSREQLEVLREYLDIEAVVLDRHERNQYTGNLSMWRDFINQGKLDDAIRVHESFGLAEITYMPFDEELIMLYKMFEVKFLMMQLNLDLAEDILEQIKPNIKNTYSEIRYHYHCNMGSLYIFHKNYPKALESFIAAYDVGFDDKGKYKHMIHYNLGMCYSYLGMSLRAIVHYERTDNMFKREAADFFPLLIDNGLAVDYAIIGEMNLAKKRLAECVKRAQALSNKIYSCAAMRNLGWICFKEKDFDRALDYFAKADKFISEGEDAYFENLYFKNLCRIVMKSPLAEDELANAKKVLQEQGNDYYQMLFTSLSHLLTLKDELSIKYIENTTIPRLIERYEYYKVFDYYELLENLFEANGEKIKALEIKVASSNLYKKMTQGGVTYEKEIDWPDFSLGYGN